MSGRESVRLIGRQKPRPSQLRIRTWTVGGRFCIVNVRDNMSCQTPYATAPEGRYFKHLLRSAWVAGRSVGVTDCQSVHAVSARGAQPSVTGIVIVCLKHLTIGIGHTGNIQKELVVGEGFEGIVCLCHLRQKWKTAQR